MQGMNTRKLAFEIIYGVLYEGKFSNQELALKVDQGPMTPADRRLTRTMVYGVIENSLWLEWVIDQLSSVKIKKIDKRVLVLLKLGLYQLAFLDRIPESAAVNETVKLVKVVNFKSSGFVNAILRAYTRQKDTLKGPDESDTVRYLSVKYSHPQWLVQHWLDTFGKERTESLLIADNEASQVYLRVNMCETNVDEALKSLESQGYKAKQVSLLPYALIVQEFGEVPLAKTEVFQKGWAIVQDVSSMMVGEILSPQPGDWVLDTCSAPGGKTTHLAEKMNRTGKLIARDVSLDKLAKIRENCERLHHDFVQIECKDATVFEADDALKYDKILVDAPCSGLGIIRRKPEIRINRRNEDILNLLPIQSAILEAAAPKLKVGGEMVYSTCTIDSRENVEQVKRFIERHPEFEIAALDQRFAEWQDDEGFLQMYQTSDSWDGFFIAKLKKKESRCSK